MIDKTKSSLNDPDLAKEHEPLRVLIIFNAVTLYGMERGVIDTFDLLRPEITPHFLMSYTTYRKGLPVLEEIKRRGISHSFFSDKKDWVRIGKPDSVKYVWTMMLGLVRGNIDAFKASLDCDVIYLPGVPYFYFSFLAILYARLNGKRIIYHFHDLLSKRYSKILKLETILITDFVHNTQLSHQEMVRVHPFIERKRNFVIPNPIGSRKNIQEDVDVRSSFEGKRNILFVGQVSKHKGVDILIKALQLISGSYSDVALHIIGGCINPTFEQEAYELARGANCEIKFWGYRQDIIAMLKSSYLHVHPSPPSMFQESFGISTAEAMANGVPTVCLGSGALREVVVHKQTGYICQEETPASLAEGLKLFLDDPEFRNQCGQRARVRYEENYTDAHIKSLWLQLFREQS